MNNLADEAQDAARASDPVRSSRAVFSEALRTDSVDRIVEAMTELRKLGRTDLGLLLASAKSAIADNSEDFLLERVTGAEKLGYLDEALRLTDDLTLADRNRSKLLSARTRLLARTGRPLDASLITRRSDIAAVLGALPSDRISQRDWQHLVRRAGELDRREAMAAELRRLASQANVFALRVAIGGLLLTLRLWSGGRKPYVTAMGEFTRLADLVDRIDPLLRRLRNKHDDRFRLFVIIYDGYPNRRLLDLYGRAATFIRGSKFAAKVLRFVEHATRKAGLLEESTTDYRAIKQDFQSFPPVIGLRSEEERALEEEAAQLGIDPQKPLVVFGLRDMAYYKFYGDVMNVPLEAQGRRASTHHRCPPVSSYEAMALHWAQRGHQVVRMGLRVSEGLETGVHENIIDYASRGRSDALDVLLFKRCRFLVAGDTGLFSGSSAFDRPSVLSDLFLIRNTMYSSSKSTQNIFVPKLVRDLDTGSLLTFRELIHHNSQFSFAEDCEDMRVEIVHNSSEDIILATDELVARLEQRHTETSEDRELQQAFRSLYAPGHMGYQSTGLISAAFLRKYAQLLD